MSLIFLLIFVHFNAYDCAKLQPNSFLIVDVIKNCFPDSAHKVVHFSCNKLESSALLYNIAKNGFYGISIKMPVKNIPFYAPPNSVVYITDLSCNNSHELLIKANQLQLFAAPFRWVLIKDSKISQDELSNINILVDSDIIICAPSVNNTIELMKVYKRKQNTSLIFERYANWSAEGLVINNQFDVNTVLRRKNLNRTILNACLVITNNRSFAHLTDKREKHIDTIAKVNYVFMQHIGDMLNADLKYTSEPSWGYQDNMSKWSGMIGELITGKADIGGTALFLTKSRVPVIDYIAMTTPTKVKFVFRQPKLSYITNVFTLPFNTSVWISCLALVLIMAAGLYFVIKWEWYKKRIYGINDDDKYPTDTELQDSAYDVCFLAYGAICQQGTNVVPYNTAGRLITVFLFTSLMFLYTSYSANIVALLQSSSTSIQTLNDLLHSPLQVGVDDTVYNRFYFPNASEPVRRALYLQKVIPAGEKPRYFTIEEGVRRMREGLFAFHMETGPGYKIVVETFMEDEKCGLQEIQFLQVTDTYLAIKKNSSYKEILKMGFRKVYESGIQNRELSLLYTKKPPCISRGSSFIGVGMVDCYLAVAVFTGGVIGSMIIFSVEILYYKFNIMIN